MSNCARLQVARGRPQDELGRDRLAVLDGFRGAAAMVVLFFHLAGPTMTSVFPLGFLAVDFFFVMSGFVLARVYEDRLRSGLTGVQFMRARIARLYPVYALAILLCLPGAWLRASDPADFIVTVGRELLLIPNFNGGLLYTLAIVSWSLALELAVSAAFAFGGFRLGSATLAVIAAMAGAGVAASAVRHGSVDLGFITETFWGGSLRAVFGFTVGVLIWRRLAAGWRTPRIAVGAAAVLLIGGCALPQGIVAVQLALVLLAFPAAVACAAHASCRPGGASDLMRWVGSISYPLYLLHVPLVPYNALLLERVIGSDGAVVAAGSAALTLLWAHATARWYEPWARRSWASLRSFGDKRRSAIAFSRLQLPWDSDLRAERRARRPGAQAGFKRTLSRASNPAAGR